MDSSNSQRSQPASASDPGSGSGSGYDGSSSGFEYDGSGSNSRTRSGSGGSTGETSPSAGNTPQEGDNSSSSMQWKSSTGDEPENEDDVDVDMADSSTSTKPQPKSSAGKEKVVDIDIDTATASSSSSNREGKAEEIGLLTDLYNLHNKTGRYVMSGSNDQRDFYKFWIHEERDYANKQELDNKINELHARFLKNMVESVEGPTDPIDVEILRLSLWIWGGEIDSFEETDDGDLQKDSEDLADVNMVNDGDDDGVNPHDSSQHETAKPETHHGVDDVDLKDSTSKESCPIKKD